MITKIISQNTRVYIAPLSRYATQSLSLDPLNIRSFSSNPERETNESKVDKKEKIKYKTPVKTPEEAKKIREWLQAAAEKNTGALFHYIKYKGRQNNPLTLKDLKTLLERCINTEDIDPLIRAVEYYQARGEDFDEAVANHFVDKCVELNRPCAAAKIIGVYKNRIGAWVAPENIHELFKALAWREDKEELKMIFKVAEVMQLKRIQLSEETMEIMLKLAINHGNQENYNKAVELLGLCLGLERGPLLAAKYPKIARVEVDQGADDGEEEVK